MFAIQCASLPMIDFSDNSGMHTVIASGKTVYQGHPTTLLSPDGTIFCVWTINHGGPCGPLAKSSDGGKTWKMIPTPENWKQHINCPTIWHLPAPGEPERLAVYAQEPETLRMAVSFSGDGGNSWSPMAPCGGNIVTVMPWTSILPLPEGNGMLIAVTNARPDNKDERQNLIIRSYSADYGKSWSAPEVIADLPEGNLCEPWILPSPDGSRWACLLRANNRALNSMVIFSADHGKSWSRPQPLPGTLKGDRHIAGYLPDGRIIAVFRNMNSLSPAYGHFCGWIGRWDDLVNGTPGELTIKLLHHFSDSGKIGWDCGYPGLEIFPDGSILTTTYIRYRKEDAGNSVVCLRIPYESIRKQ